MKHATISKLIALACAVVCSCSLIVGCAGGQSAGTTEEQKANSAYMLQVNEIMVELDDSLALFVDAVSRGDVVNMRTQADNAYKVLDKLSKAEAPEALKDIKASYVEGANKLREALDGYISLYSDLAKAGDEIDKDDYDARLAEIQRLYDEGIAALRAGDEKAAGSSSAAASSASSATSAADSSSAAAQTSEMSSPTGQSGEASNADAQASADGASASGASA